MKRIAAWLLILGLVLMAPAQCSLASADHALDMDAFIASYGACIQEYQLLGVQWDAEAWELLSQQGTIGQFDYDGLLVEAELQSNSLRILSVRVPLDTPEKNTAARRGSVQRMISLIAVLETAPSALQDSASRTEALAAATKQYEKMFGRFAVLSKPQSKSVPLHRGQQYNYLFLYEDSTTPAYFAAELIR